MERDESSLRAPKHGKARGKPVRMTRPGRQILWGWLDLGEGTLHEGGQQGGGDETKKGAERPSGTRRRKVEATTNDEGGRSIWKCVYFDVIGGPVDEAALAVTQTWERLKREWKPWKETWVFGLAARLR
ncbi:hypothetical protein NEUTE2DRAFT_75974 [Neurospora tetrasperma FGSC 2509]|nr:hypothetical protein NEUTE2DRAFT_75974 [Neurospora tetrasperma FGSC 2509]